MEYIAHRINTIDELLKISKEYGVEVDVRDFNENLIRVPNQLVFFC